VSDTIWWTRTGVRHYSVVNSDESQVPRAIAKIARLRRSSERESPPRSSGDPLIRFKREQLRCIVMDEPWDTSLAWADAQIDLPEIAATAERDRAVADVLLQMHD
jgi:hypothetical protein